MNASTLALLAGGLILLVAGAELLVRGASRLALALGVSPLVIGLTVVAYGTSAPELAVSVQGASGGRGNIALGNVVGSNICNVLLILGASALVAPLAVARQVIRLDVPIMIAASILFAVLSLDGDVERADGTLLLAALLAYSTWVVRKGRAEGAAAQAAGARATGDPESRSAGHRLRALVFVAVGLGLLVLGSRWLVDGAVAAARALGISDLVIGLTIVAVGTSLPELVTSVLASLKGERDLAVGNVVGSNLFNILGVLGLSAIAAPDGIAVPAAALRFDLPVMLAVALACLPIFFTGHSIARWEGGVFLGYYAAYTSYLVLDAAGHDALPAYSTVMLEYVIPITVITLAVLLVRSLK